MAPQPPPQWQDPLTARLDSEKPYLRIAHTTTYIRDYDRTLAFYVDQLGFTLVADRRNDLGPRLVAVAPPDGSTLLALVVPEPGTPEELLVGTSKRLVFLTEDVEKVYQQWLARGVVFKHPPQAAEWDGFVTSLEDPDGNLVNLAGFDRISEALELQRQEAAAKLEAERRATQELEIARDVQMRLFPQTVPTISNLDLAGLCIQSRSVGGDYYDFLDFGEDRVGIAIGDVAGKGIAASLLMVSLQANLRSQFSQIKHDLLRTLTTLNCRFYAASHEHVYATFFLAEYNGATRQLNYVNCGHLSGLLLRADNTIHRLDPTATVIGIFPDWEGTVATCTLLPGDALLLYTDGVTESALENDEEFGEERLIDALKRHRHHTAAQIAKLIRADLQQFDSKEQFDDITLIVATALP
jgi:serine phosphatase RsbU (regulator of sigma subunit)/catechol 2,3-dioxygenase-like lactoylglutathione lyase family enzyme